MLIDQNRALAAGVTPGRRGGVSGDDHAGGQLPAVGQPDGARRHTAATLVGADVTGVTGVTIDLNGVTIGGPMVCGFTATVDGVPYSTPGNAAVNVANNTATLGALMLELLPKDFTQTALGSDALPADAPSLAAFAVRGFKRFGDDVEFIGSVDTLACLAGCAAATDIPEPRTLLLSAAAALGRLPSGRRRQAVR